MMYKIIFVINSVLVIIMTLLAITFFGLICMPILGAYQLLASIILFFNHKKINVVLMTHLIIHFSFAIITLIMMVIFTPSNNDVFFFILLPIAGILAYYHLWITYQIKLTS